jgi:hypothetical protein
MKGNNDFVYSKTQIDLAIDLVKIYLLLILIRRC